jgi:hypothetical protein
MQHHLITAWAAMTMPAEVPVDAIADGALEAAFGKIAGGLEEYGYPVTGDFTPDETVALEDVFRAFVRGMAQNNPAIAALNEEAR